MDPEKERLTLRLTAEQNARLREIAQDLGISNTDLLRRGIGLLSVVHAANQEAEGGETYLCSRDSDGTFHRLHTLSNLEY